MGYCERQTKADRIARAEFKRTVPARCLKAMFGFFSSLLVFPVLVACEAFSKNRWFWWND